ncbi:MATE family efflux transporter [Sunxiuqinia sp. sy24]|uniref:MATE family efflux transporter n=1 Tax=Sunxiuqinia sp. sy24 TaxID=3461495 RepID=UPI0040463633
MQAAKRVALNTGILYARMAITVFISLYATRLILAALGAEDYGIFNVVGGAIAMLTFLNGAMASATQRFMSYAQGEGDENKQKQIFNVSIILHLVIGFILVGVLEIVGYFLFSSVLVIEADRMDVAKLIYHFLVVSTFVTVISVPYDAVINAHENMLVVAIVGIVEAVLKLSIAIYVTYTGHDKLASYGLLMALLSIFVLLVLRIYCHKKYPEVIINIQKYFHKGLFREMTGFASWSLLISASGIITMQGMSIILNSFFGVIVNAAQGVANQISGQLMAFSNTMLKALNPVIVKSEGENNREQMLMGTITGSKISFFLLSFFAVPVVIEMPFILDLWLKDVPEFAIIFCRLNLIRLVINQFTVTFPTAIGAMGDLKQFSIWIALAYATLLPASYLAFKLGASPEIIYINLIVVTVGLSIIKVYFTHRLCGLSLKGFYRDVLLRSLATLLVTFLLACVPMLFLNSGFIRLIAVLSASSVAFLLMLFWVGLNKREEQLIIAISKVIFNKMGGLIK